MRLEAEEIKRLLDKAFKGMHAWWHGESSQSEMVDRFLSWPLPKTVCSDGCVTDPSYPHERSGTNLLTADEARQMLEHVVGPALAAKQAEIDRSNANG